jgi:hypothetical protein
MSANPDPRSSSSEFRLLLETDRRELVRYLERSAEENIFLLSRVAVDGVVNEVSMSHGRFYGHFGREGLDGVVFFGHRKGVVLSGHEAGFIREAAELALGAEAGWVILVAARAAADRFLSHYRWRGQPTHLNRIQDYYVLRECVSNGPIAAIRQAEVSDLEVVSEMSERMLLEDFDLAPGSLSREGIQESMRHKILDGRTWILESHGEVVFKVDVSAQYAGGAQIEGVFTRPEFRGQGFGCRGVAAVSAKLLERSHFVSLHVDRNNVSARRCYEKAGFKPHSEFRLVLLKAAQN